VRPGDAPGFIGNRMLHARWREAISIVERGIALAEDVGSVAKITFGLRLLIEGAADSRGNEAVASGGGWPSIVRGQARLVAESISEI